MRSRTLIIAFAPVLLVATGCGPTKINETKVLTLDKEVGARGLELPAPKKAMKVNVEFSSSDGTVSVLVFKKADVKDDQAMFEAPETKALAHKVGK